MIQASRQGGINAVAAAGGVEQSGVAATVAAALDAKGQLAMLHNLIDALNATYTLGIAKDDYETF